MKVGDERITIAMPADDPCWNITEAEVLEWPKTDIYDRRTRRCFIDYVRADVAELETRALRAEIKRLREIAECNDPGAVGLRPGEALGDSKP